MTAAQAISANLQIILEVECPHCEEYIDLLDPDMGLNDEGEILKQCCPVGHWHVEHMKFKQEVKCPECKKGFTVHEINW